MIKQILIVFALLNITLCAVTFSPTTLASTDCTGTLDASSDTITSNQAYVWTFTDADGNSFTSSVTAAQFDIAEINTNGSFNVAVSITDSTDNTVAADTTNLDITIAGCSAAASAALDKTGVSSCTGNITAAPSATLTGSVYKWSKTPENGSATAGTSTTSNFDVATELGVDGTHSVTVTITGILANGKYTQETATDSAVALSGCSPASSAAVDSSSFTTQTCTGTLAVTLDLVTSAETYAWTWTENGNNSNTGTGSAATFDVTDIGANGTYDISVSVVGDSGANTDTATAQIVLASCPVTGNATLDKTAVPGTGCTGSVTATLDAITAASPAPTYSWTWTGTSTSSSPVTTADFNVATAIGANGTYNLSLTATGQDANGAVAMDSASVSITLASCPTGGNNDDDDDSSSILAVFVIALLALIL